MQDLNVTVVKDADGYYTQTRTEEDGTITTRRYNDPDCRLVIHKYGELSPIVVKAYTAANRYRTSEKTNAGEVTNLDVIRALNYLHSHIFPTRKRPEKWHLVNGKQSRARIARYFEYEVGNGRRYGFSMNKHLKTYATHMQESFRHAIKYQSTEWKNEWFEARDLATDLVCAQCDKRVWNDKDGAQVDHVIKFQVMLDAWVKYIDEKFGRAPMLERNLHWPTNDPAVDYHLDQFIKFHKKYAKYQMLCVDCNQADGHEYAEQRMAEGKSWHAAVAS